MPAHPHPSRGDAPFPRSRGWSGTRWADVIDHHVQSHAGNPGGDYIIGFDDADRLCVTCYGEKGYATRIPLPLVQWTESEMRAAGIDARPNHPRQFRLERGAGRSRLSEDPLPDLGALKAAIADRCGVAAEDLRIFPGAGLVNLSIDSEGPILLRETAMNRHAISWLEREHDEWTAFIGIVDPREPDAIRGSWASRDVRQIRGGSVINWMEMKLGERVAQDAELARSVAGMRAAPTEDDAPSP